MANAIDIIVSKEAIKGLTELELKLKNSVSEIIKLSSEARKANEHLIKINTPKELNANNSNNAKLTSDLQKQATIVANLQKQIVNLTAAKAQSNVRTTEEIVNTRVLTQNANRQAQATSNLAGAYANLSAQQSIASKRYQDLIVRGKTASQTQAQYNRELRAAQTQFQSLNTRVLAADRAVGRFNRNVGNYPQQAIAGITGLLGAFGVIGGVGLIAAVTKDIFQQTKQLQSLDLALKQVIGSQEDFVKAQDFLLRVSEQYGVGINELTKSFTQFYVSAKDKLSGKEIEGIFESISKAAGSMGLSVEQQDGAFLALTQMLSKGTVQAEELRGQLSERLPGAFGILAKSMGVSEQVLNKMLKDGKVMAAEVLPAFAKEVEKAYGIENLKRVESLNAETTRLGNSWTNLIRSFNEGDGAISKFFTSAVKGFNEFLGLLQSVNKTETFIGNYNKKTKEGSVFMAELIAKLREQKKSEAEILEIVNLKSAAALKNRDNANWDLNALKSQEKQLIATIDGIKLNALGLPAITDTFKLDRAKKELKEVKKEMKDLALVMGFNNGLVVGANNFKNPEKATKATDEDTKATKKNTKAKREQVEGIEAQSKSYEGLLMQLESQISILKQVQNQFSNTSQDYLYYQKLIDDTQKFVDAIKSSEDELAISAKKATDQFRSQAESMYDGTAAMKAFKEATDDYIKSFQEGFLQDANLSSLQIFFDGTFNQLLAGADSLEKKFAVTFLAISEVAKEAFNFINSASQRNFDAEYGRLEMQKDVALQFAGESTTAQLAITEQYDERRRAIQNREAEAQKKLALFNIGINTAQATLAAYASQLVVGDPTSIIRAKIAASITLGIGLAQLAFAANQQIPAFFEGGEHDGGLMLVNDGKGSKYKETIVTPDGKIIKPQGRDVLMDAPKGTQIYTHDQWQGQMMKGLLSQGITANKSNGLSKDDFNSGIERLIKSTNRNSGGFSFDERGVNKWKATNGQRTKVLNNRLFIKNN